MTSGAPTCGTNDVPLTDDRAARMTDFLRETINHLAKGREIVQRQRNLLAKLKSDDLSTLGAEQTLKVFQISLTTFERSQWNRLRELSGLSEK